MGEVKFHHRLPKKVLLTTDRKKFIVNYCRGKVVLHLGCVDRGLVENRIANNSHLHLMLIQSAKLVYGIDIDEEGIRKLQLMGVRNLEVKNAESLEPQDINPRIELIVASEILEHLSNPGFFLDRLHKLGRQVLISVPNAFSFRTASLLKSGIELVHEDHNFYFSYVTLLTLLRKHGFAVQQVVLYYWPSRDKIGIEFEYHVRKCPYCADGIIAIAVPK